MRTRVIALVFLLSLPVAAQQTAAPPAAASPSTSPTAAAAPGYFRFPAVAGDTIVFTAEGDLWRVAMGGGVAQRLTTHAAEESRPAVSPDGRTLAYSASYEGPTEVYTMPLDVLAGGGGAPVRRTFEGATALVVGWTPAGQVLYSTRRHSTLPDAQLATVDLATGDTAVLPLAQASEGAYDASGARLIFTRLPFQGSYTKRYRGGTAQNLWSFTRGAAEATPLTADFAGTSKSPMLWQGRVYFLSDRDGTMNLWSMAEAGGDLRQHTRHVGFDMQSPSLGAGRIAYQLGADLHVYDIASGRDAAVPIRLVSDFEHTRERWVKAPTEWITSAHLSATADRLLVTTRGQLFSIPARQGRIVEVTRNKRVRYREARFMPDGKSVLAMSDESGEFELWTTPANGIGASTPLTNGAKVLRWDGVPSPDGKLVAHHDKDLHLWISEVATKTQKLVATGVNDDFRDVRWSPDSRWLAYAVDGPNQITRVYLYNVAEAKATALTTDRYDSYSPAWSPDGKWIYFLSDRHLESVVGSPWGARQPEPFFDRQTKLYQIALKKGERSPFQPDDELTKPSGSGETKDEEKKDEEKESKPAEKTSGGAAATTATSAKAAAPKPPPAVTVTIDLADIERRLIELPVPRGNYSNLDVDAKRLYVVSTDTIDRKRTLKTIAIDNKKTPAETFLEDIRRYELSLDRKKLLVQKSDDFYIVDAGAKAPGELAKSKVDLSGWTFRLDPRDEWRQMFVDAWRMERDYFYDRRMHGVDWAAVRERYAPLVERVTDRAELSDLLSQMVGELSALHIFVRGGELRRGQDDVTPASLGARFARDIKAGGFRVEHIYRSDPDVPEETAPLLRPGVDVGEGDVIEQVNGVPASSAPDIASLLRNQANRQVLLRVRPKGAAASRDVVATPITLVRENDLRYDEWEYTRRLAVESKAQSRIGYVHLRAMGNDNMSEWAREFYPVFNREGLIIDVRHNRGGNIDSWLLGRLLRKAWFYFQPRAGQTAWNMQYAFRGHMVVLTDEFTASDGEAFAEGFRRLGLGKIIGTRTWGGEIWLSSSNVLVDRGIATAAETGVFGPEGQWLIEGHGVDPDVTVDNLPHATFGGGDAQLDAAIAHLQALIRDKPVPVPPAPPYPDKSLKPTSTSSQP
jgi:tricorn protease